MQLSVINKTNFRTAKLNTYQLIISYCIPQPQLVCVLERDTAFHILRFSVIFFQQNF